MLKIRNTNLLLIYNSGGFGKVFLVRDSNNEESAAKFGADSFKKECKYMKKLEKTVS
jgi:hypothetical protein